MATGEFVVLLDHDDMLSTNAIGAVNHEIWLDETVDYVYSDEDKIDTDGTYFGRFPKPGWSPERLLVPELLLPHLGDSARAAFAVGGFRAGFDGAQDYDLVLRVTERARKVVHIPEVLYHWRIVEGSTGAISPPKPLHGRAVDVRSRTLSSVGASTVRSSTWGMGTTVSGDGSTRRPRVSIVDSDAGRSAGRVWGLDVSYIVNMIDSVRQVSTYEDIELIVVYDASMTDERLAEIERVGAQRQTRAVRRAVQLLEEVQSRGAARHLVTCSSS